MRTPMRMWLVIGVLILPVGLAACGGDDDTATPAAPSVPTATEESTGPAFNPNIGPALPVGGVPDGGLPGCNDPDDTECPAPLAFDLDGQVSAAGISLNYPARYFDAATAEDGIVIELVPSEHYAFEEQATFQVVFADSVDEALAELTDPLTAEWTAGIGQPGMIGVVRDREQDPPVNTTIGAFPLGDGRVFVLKLVTTGQYGWDFFSRTYDEMLASLTVSD